MFEGGTKTGIDLLLLPEHRAMPYAWAEGLQAPPQANEIRTDFKSHWHIREEAAVAADALMATITPETPSRQLLLVDELGYMEFDHGQGIMEAMRVLDQGCYRDAIAVMRPKLLDRARERWAAGAGGAQNIQVIRPRENLPTFQR